MTLQETITSFEVFKPITIDPWQLVNPNDTMYPVWYWGVDATGFCSLHFTYAWIDPADMPNFVDYAD